MSSVDVFVPCYNYGRYLPQCVESVLSQSGVDIRVLIIDDASADDSAVVAAQLAKQDHRVQFVRHEQNRGHIATYNEGIEWASTDYMLLLSADDYLLPGSLARAAALMDSHTDISFVFGRVLELRPDNTTKPVLTSLSKYDDVDLSIVPSLEFIELSVVHNRVSTPTAVVRTSVQKEVGGYRPELPHTGDMEMWLRLASRGPVGIIGACQAVYRRHENNMTLKYSKTFLPDLQQRKDALDWFISSCGDVLPDAVALRARAYRGLGAEAVSQAHAAFDQGDAGISAALAKCAVELDPAVCRSTRWATLIAKQKMGLKASRMLNTVRSLSIRSLSL